MSRAPISTAMILAAGRGERMRPLTDHTPKPLLPVLGKPLLVYHIEKLAAAGVRHIVINYAHLGAQFPAQLGDGSAWGVKISYSPEPQGGLETAGGIMQALPLLGSEPFWVLNGDIWTDMTAAEMPQGLGNNDLASLVLTDNPSHHPTGDFGLVKGRVVNTATNPKFTFTGIGLYHPDLFTPWLQETPQKLALRPVFEQAMAAERLAGTYWQGRWTDVGTPARLEALAHELQLEQL